MTVNDDYYAILRVSAGAAGADIRAAYRDLMRRYHPDVNASDEAAAKAKAINEAYACLRDVSKRALYDCQRKAKLGEPIPARAPRASQSAPRPAWSVQPQPDFRPSLRFRPTWWKAAGLAGATLLTTITFRLTSATPPPDPVLAKPPLSVVKLVAATAPVAGANGTSKMGRVKPSAQDCRGVRPRGNGEHRATC